MSNSVSLGLDQMSSPTRSVHEEYPMEDQEIPQDTWFGGSSERMTHDEATPAFTSGLGSYESTDALVGRMQQYRGQQSVQRGGAHQATPFFQF